MNGNLISENKSIENETKKVLPFHNKKTNEFHNLSICKELIIEDTMPEFVSAYERDVNYFQRVLSSNARSIENNKEKFYIGRRDNSDFQIKDYNGLFYFISKMFYIFRNSNKFNITEEEVIKLKEFFSQKKKEVSYFRLGFNEYNNISKKDKDIINNAMFLKTRKHYYFFLSEYIYGDLTYNLKDANLIGKITNFYLADLRRKSGLEKGLLIREKNKEKRLNNLIQGIVDIKKNKSVDIFEGIKCVENEINKLISFKINISESMDSVIIFDKKYNNILKYSIKKLKALSTRGGGLCDYRNERIEILEVKSNVDFIIVLFHEIGHMYDYFINYESKSNCRFIKSKRMSKFSDIKIEKWSIVFEKMAQYILANKYNLDLNNIKKNDTVINNIYNFVFDIITKSIKEKIKCNYLTEEMFFYKYYLFREQIKYNDCELEEGIDIYTCGNIEADRYLKDNYFNKVNR